MMRSTILRLSCYFATAAILFGCAASRPHRTELVGAGEVQCPFETAHQLPQCAHITPETGKSYELHFVEFDDQGWAGKMPPIPGHPGVQYSQIDHLMKRLDKLLGDERQNLNIILYVHGWKHGANSDDGDVKKFRQILESSKTIQNVTKGPSRKVIGIYVGWRGKSWNLPGKLLNLSFWSRKGAALRVSRGDVQELFSRLRTLQQHYNVNDDTANCALPREGRLTTGGCRVKTLMIGHSFGAWILYSAISSQIISALNAEKDLDHRLSADDKKDAAVRNEAIKREANRRPADMVVLVNPAFEAVRYEAVHRAALNYRSRVSQPPILVTISSSADRATGVAFPIGRSINSLSERPVTSPEQGIAMTRTHGNIERYQTHVLRAVKHQSCLGWSEPPPLSSGNAERMLEDESAALENRNRTLRNKEIETENTARFFNENTLKNGLLGRFLPWTRDFCGGTQLSQLSLPDLSSSQGANSLVWNIRTDEEVIPSHTDIMGESFLEFVRQLYDDVDMTH